MYVADLLNNKIRKITPAGDVTTLAGSTQGFADANGAVAQFNAPSSVATDAASNVYVADQFNHKIRKITPAGDVTTLAGSTEGFADGNGAAAQFNRPRGVATDAAGNVYVADHNNHKIRKIGLTGYQVSPVLPAGLSFDPATGSISGTPNVISAATNYTITATNVSGSSSTVISIALVAVSTDANLNTLTMSAGTLSPVFTSATLSYTAAVSNATSSLTVTPTVSEANATVQVRVNAGSYATVASGNPSASLALAVGGNTIDVKVTAQDGSTIKTYTITATRAASPEINLKGNNTDIVNGSSITSIVNHTDFGSQRVSSGEKVITFTIENIGSADLNLTGMPKVALSGSSDFRVSLQPTSPITASSGSTTFQITFDPSTPNVKNAVLSIENDDTDENPFTFAISGTGICDLSFTTGSFSSPSTCAGTNGSIDFIGTNILDGVFTMNFKKDANVTSKSVNVSSSLFTLSGLAAGVYSDFTANVNGCEILLANPITLSNPILLATASNTGPYNEGQKIDLYATGGTSYSWTGPNGFISTLPNPGIPSAVPANAGMYSVMVSDQNNCSTIASTMVSISCSSQALNYYLVFADGNPQIIAPLVPNLQVQASNRPMSVIAVMACEQPLIESVLLQLSGSTYGQFQFDNEMPFNLHDFYNVNVGDVLVPNYYTFIARGYDQDNSLGNVITGPDVIGFYVLLNGSSITATTASVNEVCVGGSFRVSAISQNHEIHPFGVGNLYQVYLSDVNGNFMSRTLIGSGANPDNITCQIPSFVQGSNKYKLMVISTSPIVASEPSVLPLTVIGNDLILRSAIDYINSIVSNHKSISTIIAENKLIGTAKSDYTAGRFIELKPGFSVEKTGVFEARIKHNCP